MKHIETNFTGDLPDRLYVSLKTWKIYKLNETEDSIDLEHPLTGISLLNYRYTAKNSAFKIYDLKKFNK